MDRSFPTNQVYNADIIEDAFEDNENMFDNMDYHFSFLNDDDANSQNFYLVSWSLFYLMNELCFMIIVFLSYLLHVVKEEQTFRQ